MRILLALLAVASAGVSITPSVTRDPHVPVALSDIVPVNYPLRAQRLQFDARFAQAAAEYLEMPDDTSLAILVRMPATKHLLAHARQFDYAVSKDSGEALVRELLARVGGRRESIRSSVAYFFGPLLDDPRWVDDALSYLPDDFRFQGRLFLIAGYDIGVALAPNASLNAAHPHFEGHSRELLYYAIHELHHVGFMTYSPPPRMADFKTCADVLRLIEYSTALEGTAVLAALGRRSAEHALGDDEDYVALGDDRRMAKDEERYFQDYDALKRRGIDAADKNAFAVIERMSGGERLWYRVGARMAARVERALGRPALIAIVTRQPERLVSTYRQVAGR